MGSKLEMQATKNRRSRRMRVKLSYILLQGKERNIVHRVLGDSEVVGVGMSNFRDKISCLSCSLWLNDGEAWDNKGI